VADGTKFEVDVTPVGVTEANSAAGAVTRLASSLDAAKGATTSAAAAVAAAEAKYKDLEAAASSAAKAEERIADKIAARREKMAKAMAAGDERAFWRQVPALEALEEKQRAAVAAAVDTAAAVSAEAAALDGLRANLDAATAAQAAAAEAAAAASAAYDKETARQVAAAAETLKANEAAYAAAVAYDAETAKIMAASDAQHAMLQSAYESAEAERKLADELSRAAGAASDAAKAEKALAREQAAAEKAAQKDAEHRKAALKTGKESFNLYATAAAAAAAVVVAFGVAAWSVLSTVVSWADKNKRLEKSQKKLGENLKKTFGGLKIDALLDGFDTLVALFDSSTASGKALKFLFETLFQPLVDAAAAAIPMVERLFLQAVALALRAYIALKPYKEEIAAVAKAFGIAAAIIGGVVIASIVAFVGFIAVGIGLVVALVAAVVAAAAALYDWVGGWDGIKAAIGGALGAIGSLVEAAVMLPITLGEMAVTAAGNIIDGLVSGIRNGAGVVVDAIKGLASSAMGALTSVLKIGSPSKVFENYGGFTAEGFAVGVDKGAPMAKTALEQMANPADLSTQSARAAGAGRGQGGLSVTFGDIHLSGGGAKEQFDEFRDLVTDWLEDVGVTLGAGEVPA
jgi:hypothetical protein